MVAEVRVIRNQSLIKRFSDFLHSIAQHVTRPEASQARHTPPMARHRRTRRNTIRPAALVKGVEHCGISHARQWHLARAHPGRRLRSAARRPAADHLSRTSDHWHDGTDHDAWRSGSPPAEVRHPGHPEARSCACRRRGLGLGPLHGRAGRCIAESAVRYSPTVFGDLVD